MKRPSWGRYYARDCNGWSQGSPDPADFGKVNRLVRERCPAVINSNSTDGDPELTTAQAWEMLGLSQMPPS
jgi:hypothetical protein